jgi:hypothetical protein
VERLKPGYTITEAGQDARVSMLTGRPAAHKTTRHVNHCFDSVFADRATEFVCFEEIAFDQYRAGDDGIAMTFGKIVVDDHLMAVGN